MNEISERLLNKAARAIAPAEREFEIKDAESSVSRAYYAMFYLADALLHQKGLKFKKHGGVHGAFGEQVGLLIRPPSKRRRASAGALVEDGFVSARHKPSRLPRGVSG